MGTWEFNLVEVDGDRARIGDRGNGRLGPARLESVEFDRQVGLTVVTSQGTVLIPASDCHVLVRG